ncbi:MAG TPA: S-layer homology domain-containing protein [Fervidobacterium sp.]|nr:S-layer homology domain-containing protein [Fervidobacterium sp.]HUM76076.1 S-layer homology domain-containing protein [Fervidobacterium sp.]
MFTRKRFLMLSGLVSVLLFLIFGTSAIGATINDLSSASAQYKAVSFLVDRKIMEVDQNNNFKPSLLVSKLDLAKYLYNLITYYKLENSNSTVSSEEISKIQSRVSSLEKQMQSSISAQSGVQSDLSDLKKRITALESKVTSITTTSSSQASQITPTDFSKDIDSLSKRVATLEKGSSDLSKIVDQLSKRITTLEQKDASSQISSISKDLDSLSKRVTTTEQSVAQVNSKIAVVNGDISKISTNINDINSNLNAFNTEVTNNIQRIDSKISALESSLKSSQQDIGKIVTVSAQVSKLDGRISALEQSSQQSSQRLSALENSVSQNSTDIENLKPLNGLYASTSKEVSALSQRISKIEEIINKGDDFIKRLDAIDALTIVDTIGNFQVLSNRFDQLVAKYTKIEDQMRALSIEQQYILNEISNVKDTVVKTSELSNDISTLTLNQDKAKTDLESLNEEVSNLRSELEMTRWIAIAGTVTSVVLGILFIVTAGQ